MITTELPFQRYAQFCVHKNEDNLHLAPWGLAETPPLPPSFATPFVFLALFGMAPRSKTVHKLTPSLRSPQPLEASFDYSMGPHSHRSLPDPIHFPDGPPLLGGNTGGAKAELKVVTPTPSRRASEASSTGSHTLDGTHSPSLGSAKAWRTRPGSSGSARGGGAPAGPRAYTTRRSLRRSASDDGELRRPWHQRRQRTTAYAHSSNSTLTFGGSSGSSSNGACGAGGGAGAGSTSMHMHRASAGAAPRRTSYTGHTRRSHGHAATTSTRGFYAGSGPRLRRSLSQGTKEALLRQLRRSSLGSSGGGSGATSGDDDFIDYDGVSSSEDEMAKFSTEPCNTPKRVLDPPVKVRRR